MKRPRQSDGPIDLVSSDESSDSEIGARIGCADNQSAQDIIIDQPSKQITSEDALIRKAEMYQEYMKQIPIPTHRGSLVPCTTWMGLGKSIKELYGQPLHYLTNVQLKNWDKMRIGSENEHESLDTIIHPSKAETTIWLIEEIHRRTSSYHHVAKLWLSDPTYHACIDSIFPQLGSA